MQVLDLRRRHVRIKVHLDLHRVVAGVAWAKSEERVKVKIALQFDAEVVDLDAAGRGFGHVPDDEAVAEGTEELLHRVGCGVAASECDKGSSDATGVKSRIWASDWNAPFQVTAQIRDFTRRRTSRSHSEAATPHPTRWSSSSVPSATASSSGTRPKPRPAVEINDLRIELEGDLDLHTFLGLRPGHAGYDAVKVKVHLDANATPAEIEDLHEAVVGTSPVGHTLQAAVPVSIELA